MEFKEATISCLTKFVTFSGRAPRSEYWWFVLFCAMAGFAASFLETIINAVTGPEDNSRVLTTSLNLLLCLPSFAVSWRRLHDVGKPGYYSLYPWIVFVGLIFWLSMIGGEPNSKVVLVGLLAILTSSCMLIWWLTRPSEPDQNEYGPNPLEASAG